MPIYKKKNGSFYVSFYYRDHTGKLLRKKKEGFKKRKDAQLFMETFLLKTEGNVDMSFETLVELYLEDSKARVKPTTFEYKKYVITLKILPFFEKMRLLDIEPIHIRRWQNELITNDKNFSPTYLKTINNQLNAVLNYAVKYYKLPSNPARLCGAIGKKHADKMEFWTRDEFFRFREKVKDKEMSEVIFDLFFYTGIREGELLALTLEDFDFKNKKVSINKSYSRIKGKDLIQSPKTPKSKRMITIPKFLSEKVEEFAERRYDYRKDERFFPITKYYLHHEMNRGSKLSGVKRIRIHDLRHSHVALLIEMNVPILLISERLGHDNPETTLRIYGHLYPNKHEEIADKLNILEENKEENKSVVRF